MDAPQTRLLVVDDHPAVRQGLEHLLEAEPDLEVVAEAATAAAALRCLDATEVDFVVLDIGLRKGSGLDLIGQIRARRPALPILMLSMHHERFYAERAIRRGAQGYVMKQGDPAEIVPAIRRILSGDLYLSEALADELVRRAVEGPEDRGAASEQLSDREAEVVRLIGGGSSTREVAEELGLSVKTVESYRATVKRKLNLGEGAEPSRFAYDGSSRSMGVTAGA